MLLKISAVLFDSIYRNQREKNLVAVLTCKRKPFPLPKTKGKENTYPGSISLSILSLGNIFPLDVCSLRAFSPPPVIK